LTSYWDENENRADQEFIFKKRGVLVDQITRALLGEFVQQNSLHSLEEGVAFEHFAGYLVTATHYGESFPTDDIAVGAGGDCGIDCIAVVVNGSLVTEPEEVEDLATTNGYLDVTFIFTQAERSSSFETQKIGQFGFGVRDFFSDRPQLVRNEELKHYGLIWRAILERSRYFRNGNPQCFLYYATTGRWTEDANLVVRRDAERNDVEALGLFRNVVFKCLGASELQRLYRQSQNAISAEITFSERTVVPDIPGVEQAYLGLLPASEFLKLVENESGDMRSAIFYDNVRHWQEWNDVNKEMRATLSDAGSKVLFPLLNNGITVVARRVNATANRFLVEDYQIVNGCQTSFVLHQCRVLLNERVMVPVRLIATLDDGVKNAIIKATNRQTEVTEEQLFALSDFPKKLESYFPTFDLRKRLYYERRSRQYNGEAGIEKVRVISMTVLVRAFASMFLELPHRTTRNYKALLNQVGAEIFHSEHKVTPYYVSAFAHYRMEYFFRNQALNTELKPARYHLLMTYRKLTQPDRPPRMNSHEIERYCDEITRNLWDDERCRETFEAAASHITAVAAGNMDRDNIRTEAFTHNLNARLQQQHRTGTVMT
jgi:hypothetical protein